MLNWYTDDSKEKKYPDFNNELLLCTKYVDTLELSLPSWNVFSFPKKI